MSGFLLDTNLLSELIRPKPEQRVVSWLERLDENLLYLSALTLGEIRKGITALAGSGRRARLEVWLETGLRPRFAGRILPVDEAVADRWGALAGWAHARGTPLPVIDGLLAATAIEHDLTLVTRNAPHVARTGVRVLNPWAA